MRNNLVQHELAGTRDASGTPKQLDMKESGPCDPQFAVAALQFARFLAELILYTESGNLGTLVE